MTAQPPQSTPPLLAAHICQRSSANVRGINILSLFLLPLFALPGIGFALIGAWPIAGFLSVALFLLYGVLRWHIRRDRTEERIEIDETRARVFRGLADRPARCCWQAPANWLDVQVRGRPGAGGGVELRARTERILIGQRLAQVDREHLARALRGTVLDLRRAPHLRAPAYTLLYPRPSTSSME